MWHDFMLVFSLLDFLNFHDDRSMFEFLVNTVLQQNCYLDLLLKEQKG